MFRFIMFRVLRWEIQLRKFSINSPGKGRNKPLHRTREIFMSYFNMYFFKHIYVSSNLICIKYIYMYNYTRIYVEINFFSIKHTFICILYIHMYIFTLFLSRWSFYMYTFNIRILIKAANQYITIEYNFIFTNILADAYSTYTWLCLHCFCRDEAFYMYTFNIRILIKAANQYITIEYNYIFTSILTDAYSTYAWLCLHCFCRNEAFTCTPIDILTLIRASNLIWYWQVYFCLY